MLFWHKHNFEKALADLPNFTPFPDEWTVEDKVLFEQAFNFHGKSFQRIRQMVCLLLQTASALSCWVILQGGENIADLLELSRYLLKV